MAQFQIRPVAAEHKMDVAIDQEAIFGDLTQRQLQLLILGVEDNVNQRMSVAVEQMRTFAQGCTNQVAEQLSAERTEREDAVRDLRRQFDEVLATDVRGLQAEFKSHVMQHHVQRVDACTLGLDFRSMEDRLAALEKCPGDLNDITDVNNRIMVLERGLADLSVSLKRATVPLQTPSDAVSANARGTQMQALQVQLQELQCRMTEREFAAKEDIQKRSPVGFDKEVEFANFQQFVKSEITEEVHKQAKEIDELQLLMKELAESIEKVAGVIGEESLEGSFVPSSSRTAVTGSGSGRLPIHVSSDAQQSVSLHCGARSTDIPNRGALQIGRVSSVKSVQNLDSPRDRFNGRRMSTDGNDWPARSPVQRAPHHSQSLVVRPGLPTPMNPPSQHGAARTTLRRTGSSAGTSGSRRQFPLMQTSRPVEFPVRENGLLSSQNSAVLPPRAISPVHRSGTPCESRFSVEGLGIQHMGSVSPVGRGLVV